MHPQNLSSVAAAIGGSFIVGTLIGYALKKVVKLFAILVGLFFTGMAYLQYQQILVINLNKLQETSRKTLSTLANSTMQLPGLNIDHTAVLSNLGIPLTGSMSMGIAFGFLRG